MHIFMNSSIYSRISIFSQNPKSWSREPDISTSSRAYPAKQYDSSFKEMQLRPGISSSFTCIMHPKLHKNITHDVTLHYSTPGPQDVPQTCRTLTRTSSYPSDRCLRRSEVPTLDIHDVVCVSMLCIYECMYDTPFVTNNVTTIDRPRLPLT